MKKLIALLAVLAFISCKKYDEGPSFSLASKKSRVANEWKAQKVLVVFENGDIVDFTNDSKKYKWKFELKETGDVTFYSSDTARFVGKWNFVDKKEVIEFSDLSGNYDDRSWQITRLKSNELNVKEYENKELKGGYVQYELVSE